MLRRPKIWRMDARPDRAGLASAVLAAAGVAWCAAMIPVLGPYAEEGAGQLVWIGAPVVLAAAAWLGLHRACATGRRGGLYAADAMTFLLVAFVVVTGFSIGMAYLPAGAALVAALTLMPDDAAGATAARCGPAA